MITTGATVDLPLGVAVDSPAGRIYWANTGANRLSFARLDNSGGGDLATTGATVRRPEGVAVDSPGGRIYWANTGANRLSFARLDNSGGSDLTTLAATVNGPNFPALLKVPVPAGAPGVGGGSSPGSTLSYSTGSWAGDLPPAFVFRAPRSFAFSWTLDDNDIPAATTNTLQPGTPGDYRCRVTATNQAGGTTQTSAPHTIANPAGASANPATKSGAGGTSSVLPGWACRATASPSGRSRA